jgi:hydrogen cyanide synthase HcnB
MNVPRVLVVGAGPAGIRAAATLVAAGLKPIVVDEAPHSGGQIYRRPPRDIHRPAKDLYGFEAAKALDLHRTFDDLGEAIDYRAETLVWNVHDSEAYTRHGDGTLERIPYDAILLATGAMDRIIPFPGWTTPGVYTLGAAQIAYKYQGCAIGNRVALLGTGPLLYLVAYQYAAHGVDLAAVLDTARLSDGVRALPDLMWGGATFAKGLYYRSWLTLHGVALRNGVTPIGIDGENRVHALRYRDGRGREHRLACDALAFGYSLRSETQLADLLGCKFEFDPLGYQWRPETDGDGRASVKSVYLAGDGAGISGADAAERRGELAALALLADHGQAVDKRRLARLRRELVRLQRFRRGLETAFPFPRRLAERLGDDVLLCRCEAIKAGDFRAQARDLGATEINRAKAFSRVGMGRCQGRVCHAAATEVLAEQLGCDAAAIGRLRGQAPIKPLPFPGPGS